MGRPASDLDLPQKTRPLKCRVSFRFSHFLMRRVPQKIQSSLVSWGFGFLGDTVGVVSNKRSSDVRKQLVLTPSFQETLGT